LTEFDETWSEVRQNGYEEDAKDPTPKFWAVMEIFGLKVAKNRPKSPKFYGWSKNFSKKFFLAQTILNGPIRKVIIVKVKFEDLRNFFYYQVNQARHLENFSKKIFFEKIFFVQKVSKWSNSKSYRGKSEIWRPSNFFYYQVNQARHLEKFSNFFRKNFFCSKSF
jgi:hypothetical protein